MPIPRCPDSLLASDLPDWVKMVWLSIRKVQGNNEWAWATHKKYGEMCGKDRAQTSRAIRTLREAGWVEVNGKDITCLIPDGLHENFGNETLSDQKGDEGETIVDECTPLVILKGDEESTKGVQESTGGDEESTRHLIEDFESLQESRNESEGFDLFWDGYGKKVGRKKTLTAWQNIPRYKQAQALEAVPAYVASTPDPQYRKNPLTWLHGECWNDEITPTHITSHTGSTNGTPRNSSDRRSAYGYEEASRDVDAALADLTGGRADAGAGHDGGRNGSVEAGDGWTGPTDGGGAHQNGRALDS